MRIAFLLFSLPLALANFGADVPSRAQSDQIWSATYTALVESLGNLWIPRAREDVSEKTGVSNSDLRLAFRYVRAYPADDLRLDWVLLRYPHYDRASVREDIERLAHLGLVEMVDSDRWRATEECDALMQVWNETAADHAALFEPAATPMATDVMRVLEKITARAARLESGGINESIGWRIPHKYRVPADAPLLLQIDQAVWDYIAFINDNAHYRVDRYFEMSGDAAPDLSPLAKELFASMRAGRSYELSRCSEQPVWRVGEANCREAFQSLVELGWARETEAGVFSQSGVGNEIFQRMEAITDARLYSTWEDVADKEYERYEMVIERMPEIVERLAAGRR